MKDKKLIKILHFADAHIDIANYGRHDPESGLPMRVMDFLKSLDTIVNAAVEEKVDLVIFAGDAYKDRNPAPTFQREWGKRIMRLSKAEIPTLLLVGNHDLSPALGRAHALAEFHTLNVPHVQIVDQPHFLTPDQLEGLPLQVLAIPWLSRSRMMAYLDLQTHDLDEIHQAMEARLGNIITKWLDEADPNLPTILTAHASVQGATYGGERTVMLGKDLVLPGSLVRDPRLDYVALGHIHKPQNLAKEGASPPIIYPGSIERVDFGEAQDDKFYVIAEIERGDSPTSRKTKVHWHQLTHIRPFIDRHLKLETKENITGQLREALPAPTKLEGAIVRLVLEYPRAWSALIDDNAFQEHREQAFEFHLVKRPLAEARIRLPEDQTVGSLSPIELLTHYWHASHTPPDEVKALNALAEEIIRFKA